MSTDLPRLVSPAELAAALGIDRSTISRMVRAGQPIAGLRPVWLTPGRYGFRRSEVLRVLGAETAASREVA